MNFLQRAWHDATGWLNTPEGRRLETNPNATAGGPSYFKEWRGNMPAPSGHVIADDRAVAYSPPLGPNQGFEGEYTSGVPAKTYFPTDRVVGGQPPPPQPSRYPEIRSEGQPYFPRTSAVYQPYPTPQGPYREQPSMGGTPNYAATPEERAVLPPVPPGSVPLPTTGRGPENVEVTGQPGPLPTTPTPAYGPLAGEVTGSTQAPGSTAAQTAAPTGKTWSQTPITAAPGQQIIGGQPVQTPGYGPLAGEVTGGEQPGAATGTYGPLAGEVTGGAGGAPSPATPATAAPIEHKVDVTHADGAKSSYKHTTAQAAAQKQQQQAAGQTGQTAGGGGQGGGGGQRGGGQPAQGGGQTVGQWMQNVNQGQGQPGYGGPSGPQGQAGQPGQTTVTVPAHPGLLQRIGQTIGHFFSGTLGQWSPQQQQPGTINLGQLPNQTEGSALSGIRSALAQGHSHIARHGGSAPASAPAPGGGAVGVPSQGTPGRSWAYEAGPEGRWQPTPLGSVVTNPMEYPSGTLAYTQYGVSPLGSPDIVRPPTQ